jgi:hypothetical protein
VLTTGGESHGSYDWRARRSSCLILSSWLLRNGEGGFGCDEELCFTRCYTGMACRCFAHTKHVPPVSIVFGDLQQRLWRVGVAALDDFNFGGAHRVRVSNLRVKTYGLIFIVVPRNDLVEGFILIL